MDYLTYPKTYDIIVVGAGHAGCESALSSSRLGCKTLLLTLNLEDIASMPCNPSIGGPAKGHIVREIDALGGEMAKCIDKTHIHIRVLNLSKGPAVWAYRAQAEKKLYQLEMKHTLESQKNLDLKQDEVEEIVVENSKVKGVLTKTRIFYPAKVVILTTGTFLNGLVHIGSLSFSSGRLGQNASLKLSESLKNLGFEIKRLKTGTPPRVDKKTIDTSLLVEQKPILEPLTFSFVSPEIVKEKQVSCFITWTNEKTIDIVKRNIYKSALYSGKIVGIEPRYCPSIETKVTRFPDKIRHQVFLEPEGLDTSEFYVQGMSTSLPYDVQLKYLRSLRGLENVEIMRPGYAIEYDFINPMGLKVNLETKKISGLFFAGQINGTSGYEEAGAQGLIAGINAVMKIKNKEPFVLDRSQAYIGVLIDDLITKGVDEPYRMFTARCEYRLILRNDNADLRLTPLSRKIGLADSHRWEIFCKKKEMIEENFKKIKKIVIKPTDDVQKILRDIGSDELKSAVKLGDLLKRPNLRLQRLKSLYPEILNLSKEVAEEIEIQIKYEGYIQRQLMQIEQFKKTEEQNLPQDLNYYSISNISTEGKEKLTKIKPNSLGQASRIQGVSPSDITMIMLWLKGKKK